MVRYLKPIHIMCLVAISLLFSVIYSCSRRPLEEQTGRIAMVPIKIDWSVSGLDVKQMNRATVRIFPHNGSPAYDFRLQTDLENDLMPLAVGSYSLVIFNETIDAEDWKALVFKGENKYEDFMVTTLDDSFRGLYTKAEESIRRSPDNIACWSIDNFEVTPDMLVYTKAMLSGGNGNVQLSPELSSKVEQELAKVTTIQPISIVKFINIKARVVNLSSSRKASGAIVGACGAVMLSTRTPVMASRVTHVFVMNGRVYDKPLEPTDGTIGANLWVFSVDTTHTLEYNLKLDFELVSGAKQPTEVFDISKDMVKPEVVINITLGSSVEDRPDDRPDDRPIILPSLPIDHNGVAVDEWGEEEVVHIK